MQLVFIAHVGPALFTQLGNGSRIKAARFAQQLIRTIPRMLTARARRSSSGASSRKAYGFAFSNSCAKAEGTALSTARQRIAPVGFREQLNQPFQVHRFRQ